MCSTCCALVSVGEYRDYRFPVATDLINRTCGRLGGEQNIKVVIRKNEFGVYSTGLRWHLYRTGNFKQLLVHYVFKSLAASWCQEFECK